jgi:hypothetical protein
MGINFSLFRNSFSSEANQYRAIVQSSGTIDYDHIVNLVVKQNSTVTRADVLAVLDNFFTVIEDALLLGFNVNTPGINGRVSIKGNFEGQNDGFTPGRNRVEASFSPGPRLRRAIQQAEVQKQEGGERLPRPLDYTDLNSGELNSQVTPGGMAQVTGYRLKFDPGDPNQGIFFVNGSATRVSVVGKNGPMALMFLVPAGLTPGDYSLEIRSTTSNGTLRTGVLPETLSVS